MIFRQKIEDDLKDAMRKKEELRLSVLRMLSAAIRNREIEKRTRLAKASAEQAKTSKTLEAKDLEKESRLIDEEVLAAIRSEAKKRKDAIHEYEKGGRKDLADKESAELKILEEYLPKEMDDDELEKIVIAAVKSAGASSTKDFGRVMGEVMKKTKGQASGDRVRDAVKKILPQ